MRYSDRVAIVTGGAGGIGLETAKRLGSEGARVVVADLDAGKGNKAAGEVRSAGSPDAYGAACDVAAEDQVEKTIAAAVAKWGRLDVVVNNAGRMVFSPIEKLTREDWQKVLDVDLLGAFFFIKHAIPRMKPGGAIVNVASIHAIETEPLVAPYAAAKAGLLSLTRSAAIEAKPLGIRVNAVLPGAVDTPMLWTNPNIESGREKTHSGDVGKPADIAAVIAYLASDDARFVEGASIRADGGRLDRL